VINLHQLTSHTTASLQHRDRIVTTDYCDVTQPYVYFYRRLQLIVPLLLALANHKALGTMHATVTHAPSGQVVSSHQQVRQPEP